MWEASKNKLCPKNQQFWLIITTINDQINKIHQLQTYGLRNSGLRCILPHSTVPNTWKNVDSGDKWTYSFRMLSWKCSTQYSRKLFRSVLLMPPIGLISALEQSYFVKYPVRLNVKYWLMEESLFFIVNIQWLKKSYVDFPLWILQYLIYRPWPIDTHDWKYKLYITFINKCIHTNM